MRFTGLTQKHLSRKIPFPVVTLIEAICRKRPCDVVPAAERAAIEARCDSVMDLRDFDVLSGKNLQFTNTSFLGVILTYSETTGSSPFGIFMLGL